MIVLRSLQHASIFQTTPPAALIAPYAWMKVTACKYQHLLVRTNPVELHTHRDQYQHQSQNFARRFCPVTTQMHAEIIQLGYPSQVSIQNKPADTHFCPNEVRGIAFH